MRRLNLDYNHELRVFSRHLKKKTYFYSIDNEQKVQSMKNLMYSIYNSVMNTNVD